MTNTPTRGEVWMVQFDPAIGDEQQKIRPAVVVSVPSVGRLRLRVVVPLTHWQVRYSAFAWFTYVPVTPANGLARDSGADAFQVKSVSVQRFQRRMGSLTAAQMDEIASAIALCVGFSCP